MRGWTDWLSNFLLATGKPHSPHGHQTLWLVLTRAYWVQRAMKWSPSKVSSSCLHEDTGDLPVQGQHSAMRFYFRSRLPEWLIGLVPNTLPGSGLERGQADCDPAQISLRLCWQAGEERELGELLLSVRIVCFSLFRFLDSGTSVDQLLSCQL